MDVTEESPSPELAITLPPLPAILLLPSDDKEQPFRYLSEEVILVFTVDLLAINTTMYYMFTFSRHTLHRSLCVRHSSTSSM